MRSEATLQHPGHGEIRSDRHRHRQPRRGRRRRRRRAVRGRRGQLQPCTQRTQGPEDEVVAVAPDEGELARQAQALLGRVLEVPPPDGEDEEHGAGDDRHQPCRDAVRQARTVQRHRHRGDALPQHDQREQPVALGDVPGVPRRATVRGPLGVGGHEHLADAQDVEDPQRRRLRQEQPHHPADLQDADAGRVAQGGRPRCGVTGGGPEPLGHHGDAHDDVADGHDGEVAGGEGALDPGGEDQDPDDLHEGQEAVKKVVDVVGRGEPGEVDPGPPDGEEHQQVAHDRRVEVAGPQGGAELVGRLGHRHHEGQVEQELQWRRGAVLLVDVPRAHREHPQAAARHGATRVPVRGQLALGGRHGPQYRSASNSHW